jgi:hypothetical protein
MKKIPNELIEAIPDGVEATTESCTVAADTTLLVLFLMATELDERPEFPLIISNAVEVWPLPSPWTSDEENVLRLLTTLNGRGEDPGLIEHVKRNAQEYNSALDTNDIPVAERIATQGAPDSAAVWNATNSLACQSTKEGIFRTLLLSDATKHAFGWVTRRT